MLGLLGYAVTGCDAPAPPADGTSGSARTIADAAWRHVPASVSHASVDPNTDVSAKKAGSLRIEVSRDWSGIDLRSRSASDRMAALPLSLSAAIADVPLNAVLKELARKLDVRVYIAGPLPKQTVSVQFASLPVAEGLARILAGIPYTLTYRDGAGPGQNVEKTVSNPGFAIAAIHVLPREASASLKPTDSQPTELTAAADPADVAALRSQALNAPLPAERLDALRRFLEQAEASEHNAVLLRAIEDSDTDVRTLAVHALGDEADPPFDAIAGVAASDPVPALREAALSALVSQFGAGALSTLEAATGDPDPNVQRAARLSLEMIGKARAELESATSGR
jgi:hypothetical protein